MKSVDFQKYLQAELDEKPSVTSQVTIIRRNCEIHPALAMRRIQLVISRALVNLHVLLLRYPPMNPHCRYELNTRTKILPAMQSTL